MQLQSSVNRVNLFLVSAAFVFSILALMFVFTSASSPCASAQSSQCTIGNDEIVEGSLTLQDELLTESTPTAGTAGEVLRSGGAAAPPVWDAVSALGVPSYVYKSADETDNNAPLQDDDHLFFAVDANSEYSVLMTLKTLPLTGTEQLIIDFSEPASAEWDCIAHWFTNGTGTDNHYGHNETLGSQTLTNVNNAITYQCVLTTAGTSGTFQLRWYGTGTSGYTLKEGSWLQYAKLN